MNLATCPHAPLGGSQNDASLFTNPAFSKALTKTIKYQYAVHVPIVVVISVGSEGWLTC